MNKKNSKKSLKTTMLIVLAIGLVGGALAYFSSIALTKHNIHVFYARKPQLKRNASRGKLHPPSGGPPFR